MARAILFDFRAVKSTSRNLISDEQSAPTAPFCLSSDKDTENEENSRIVL